MSAGDKRRNLCDQAQGFKAGDCFATYDDVVMHGDAKRCAGIDDGAGYFYIGFAGHGITAGVVVRKYDGARAYV